MPLQTYLGVDLTSSAARPNRLALTNLGHPW
jgi:hypothetical protein